VTGFAEESEKLRDTIRAKEQDLRAADETANGHASETAKVRCTQDTMRILLMFITVGAGARVPRKYCGQAREGTQRRAKGRGGAR
jgi:hypothetical protein